MPLAEGNSQNLASIEMLEKVKITSTKNLERALNLRNLFISSPGQQELVPLVTWMAVLLVPVKENSREAPAPYKYSCCQGWLQETQPPPHCCSSPYLTATQWDANLNLPWVFQWFWHYEFVNSAFMPYLVQRCNKWMRIFMCYCSATKIKQQ